MMTVYPDDYPDFRCSAGDCRHNCCVGWEIDIDGRTLERYNAASGALGRRLRSVISAGDVPHFVLGQDERCPFLNRENLCDLILAGGEAMLCQICADHPRFRNELPGRTEIGLGLCCEAAAALILSRREPVRLVETGVPERSDPEAEALLELRRQAFDLAQDRSKPIARRMDDLLLTFQALDPGRPQGWTQDFLALERLDPDWTALLQRLEQAGPVNLAALPEDARWEQLLVYFLYRHFLTAWEDGDVGSKVAFAVLSVRLLQALSVLCPEVPLAELARMYSAEVEYSTENLSALLDQLCI